MGHLREQEKKVKLKKETREHKELYNQMINKERKKKKKWNLPVI